MPNAVEGSNAGHRDFRRGGKVFATLGYPDKAWGMVKLSPEQQDVLAAAEPGVFEPVKGSWGERGSTQIRLDALDDVTAASALKMAWSKIKD